MKTITFLVTALITVMITLPASAQRTTERFIPIGLSPGLSGEYTYIGEITAADQSAGVISVVDPEEGQITFLITDSTDVWIDRSKQKQTNLIGTEADCEVGRRVEVKFFDYESKQKAEWVKVEPA